MRDIGRRLGCQLATPEMLVPCANVGVVPEAITDNDEPFPICLNAPGVVSGRTHACAGSERGASGIESWTGLNMLTWAILSRVTVQGINECERLV